MEKINQDKKTFDEVQPFLPAFITFGPLFMIMFQNYNNDYFHLVVSLLGALVLGIGLGCMLGNQRKLEKRIKTLEANLGEK